MHIYSRKHIQQATLSESSIKEKEEQNKSNDKKPATVDDLCKMAKVMRPGALMQFLAKTLGTDSIKFIAKNVVPLATKAVKSGWTKASSISGSIKDFSKKNKEDKSGIDYSKLKLDPSTLSFKCLFDGETGKKLMSFMDEFESEIKDEGKEIEKADKQLHDDVKKAGVKMDEKEIDDNGLAVASVIDNKENKGKKGKELKKKIEGAIKKDKQAKEIQKISKELKKASSKIKVDKKYEKMSDEELAKLDDKINKKIRNRSEASKKNDAFRSKIKNAVQKGVAEDFKKSVKTAYVSTDKLKKSIASNMKPGLAVEQIEEPRAVCISIQCGKKDFGNVLKEADGSAKIIDVTNGSKDKSIQKVIDYIKKVLQDKIGKDKLGKKIYAYLKNAGGNCLLYVFAGVKQDKLDESLLLNESKENVMLPLDTVSKITKWWEGDFDNPGNWWKANPEAIKIHDLILKNSSEIFGKTSFGNFDYKNSSMSADDFESLMSKWKKLKDASKIYMSGQEFTEEITEKGKKHIIKLFGCSGNDAFNKAIAYAKEHSEVAGDLDQIQKEYLNGATSAALEKTGSIIKHASDIPKNVDTGDEIAKKAYVGVGQMGDDAFSASDATAEDTAEKIKKMMSNVEIDGNKLKHFNSSEIYHQACKSLGLADDDMARIFSRTSSSNSIRMAENKLMLNMQAFVVNYDKDPDKAVKFAMIGLKNDQKDALAEILCKIKPEAAEKFKDIGIDIDGKIGSAAAKAADAATEISNLDKMEDGLHSLRDEQFGERGFTTYSNGKIIPAFSFEKMSSEINSMNDMFADGKLDPTEMAKLNEFGGQLGEYSKWAAENADSDDPLVKQKIAMISMLSKKYNDTVSQGKSLLDSAEAQVDDARTGATETTRAASKEMANDEEVKKAAGGWKEKLGLDKAFTALGWARLAAKSTAIILNNGKAVVDALGAAAVKFKEDNGIIAQMNFLLSNADDSDTKFSDTKFSVRFNVNDMKWHATCLDDRKMKFPEDEVVKKALDSEEGKKFKQVCLKKWMPIFNPKDKAKNILTYVMQNFEKIGLKADSKEAQKVSSTIEKMKDNFKTIEKEFK